MLRVEWKIRHRRFISGLFRDVTNAANPGFRGLGRGNADDTTKASEVLRNINRFRARCNPKVRDGVGHVWPQVMMIYERVVESFCCYLRIKTYQDRGFPTLWHTRRNRRSRRLRRLLLLVPPGADGILTVLDARCCQAQHPPTPCVLLVAEASAGRDSNCLSFCRAEHRGPVPNSCTGI